jgi:hypothetical protein
MFDKLSIEDLAACEDTLARTYEPIEDAPDTIPAPPWWDPECVDSHWVNPQPRPAVAGHHDELPY